MQKKPYTITPEFIQNYLIYQEEQEIREKQPENASFATIAQVYEDGVTLLFGSEKTPSQKRYQVNSFAVFHQGDRVFLTKDSGTYVVLFPVGAPKSSFRADTAAQADKAAVAATADRADAACSQRRRCGACGLRGYGHAADNGAEHIADRGCDCFRQLQRRLQPVDGGDRCESQRGERSRRSVQPVNTISGHGYGKTAV